MTGKERVSAAVRRTRPDRTPRDISFRSEAESRMLAFLGLDDAEQLRQHLGIDVRHIYPAYRGQVRPPEGDIAFDEWGIGRRSVRHSGQDYAGSYDEMVLHPLSGAVTVSDVLAYPMPEANWWDYSVLADRAEACEECWLTSGYYSIFERAWELMGMERVLIELTEGSEVVLALLDRLTEFYTEQTLRIMEAAGPLLDQIDTYDDIGTQTGMFFSPSVWRANVKPRQAAFNAAVKSRHPVRIWYHSCGSILPVLDDLMEIGVDILNPIQTRAAGMDAETLAIACGDRICFWGGLDTQQVLPYGSTSDVRAEVHRLENALGRGGGGFVLAPTHTVQADVPPENVVAMCEDD